MEKYTIEEHKHRLAAWAAARAASSSPICRFTVKQGFALLKVAGFDSDFSVQDICPEPDEFDKQHRKWRGDITKAGKKHKAHSSVKCNDIE